MGAVLLARRCFQHSRGRARRDPRGDVREQPRFGVPGRSFMCFCLCVRDVQRAASVSFFLHVCAYFRCAYRLGRICHVF